MRSVLIISFEVISFFVYSLPRYRVFARLKRIYLRLQGAKIGKGVTFYPRINLGYGRKLSIGDNVDLAWGVLITTGGGVEIGDRTLIGYKTQILSRNHRIPENRGKIFYSGHSEARVVIESDVWIGANCIILAGVTIGEGSVIAAGSVVTKNIEPFTVAGGVPAKTIKKR